MADSLANDLGARLRARDAAAAEEVFRRYTGRLIALARSRLSAKLAKRIDAEDIVQSAYRSFFSGASAGQLEVRQGADLWGLLATITLRKLRRQVQQHSAQKRSMRKEQNFENPDGVFTLPAEVLTQEPSPVEALALVDQVEQVMRQLNPLQRRMVELRLQGHNLDEIAVQTQRCRRTVCRILEHVRNQAREQLLQIES
ncbi:MAG: sigma-70 family RNA polymerase sigma factor [Planctomycetia bacterium]|nr:sigma-70 family RNA polymerase sigma factor [Planctomycetia bacterium]